MRSLSRKDVRGERVDAEGSEIWRMVRRKKEEGEGRMHHHCVAVSKWAETRQGERGR